MVYVGKHLLLLTLKQLAGNLLLESRIFSLQLFNLLLLLFHLRTKLELLLLDTISLLLPLKLLTADVSILDLQFHL